MEASPLFRAGVLPGGSASQPGEEDGHFCIAPIDPALPDGVYGERAGQGAQIVRNEAWAIEYC